MVKPSHQTATRLASKDVGGRCGHPVPLSFPVPQRGGGAHIRPWGQHPGEVLQGNSTCPASTSWDPKETWSPLVYSVPLGYVPVTRKAWVLQAMTVCLENTRKVHEHQWGGGKALVGVLSSETKTALCFLETQKI